jgi:restriction endonuclease Mrr
MSFTEKKISVNTLLALKDALTHIFWTKKDLRQFIELTLENSLIVSTIDWAENTKLESVSQLIDRMAKRQDIYQTDLLKLIQETGNINDFSHLKFWDDAETKIKKAKTAVEKLRTQSKGYFDTIEELKKAEQARATNQAKIKESITYQQRLDELKTKFFEIAINDNHQNRGHQLEKFLNELFLFFDLDPKSSFKITGEQIDGSFTFDNTDYLLEAKWQKKQVDAQELYGFGGKIQGKLKNTLGLYISLEGFSSESTKTENPSVKAIILMDGTDLMQILEGRIKLTDMLYIKRRHAAQTGEIYYRITGI